MRVKSNVSRHNGLEKALKQGMVAGKRIRVAKTTKMGERHHRYVWYYDGNS